MAEIILELTQSNMKTVALTLWRAARREPEVSRHAIAWSIRNRLISHGSGDVCCLPQICAELLREVDGQAGLMPRAGFGDRDYCRAFAAACLVWCDDIADPAEGANRFHRHDNVPGWAATLKPVALLGSYFFYCETRVPLLASTMLPSSLSLVPQVLRETTTDHITI